MSNSGAHQLQPGSFNQPLADASLVACPHCDLLQRLPKIAPGDSARCPRCDKELWRRQKDSVNRTLPLTLAALVLYVIANTVPMLGLTAAGHAAFTTVVGGAQQLWNSGQQIVAVLVLFAAVLAPALQIGFMLLILIGCQRKHPPAWVGTLLRHLPMTRTWSMIEVMLLGVLVALTKIADYATVIPGWRCSRWARWFFCWRRCSRTSIRAKCWKGSSGRRQAPGVRWPGTRWRRQRRENDGVDRDAAGTAKLRCLRTALPARARRA